MALTSIQVFDIGTEVEYLHKTYTVHKVMVDHCEHGTRIYYTIKSDEDIIVVHEDDLIYH